MPALTAKERARYGVRLFGNLLATTLLGGVFVAAGAGLAYYIEPAFFSQLTGEVGTDLTALAAFGSLSALGVLVFLTGFYLVAFTAVTDAVRIGTDRSALTPARSAQSAESSTEPDTESPFEAEPTESVPDLEPTESTAGREPEPTADAESEPAATASEPSAGGSPDAPPERASGSEPAAGPAPEQSGGIGAEQGDTPAPEQRSETDPFAEAAESDVESYDPTDPIDDPHEAQTSPFDPPSDEPSTAEEWTSKTPPDRDEDGEAWREEIEAKLEGDEEAEGS